MITVDNIKSLPLIIDTSRHNGQLTKAQIKSTGCVLLIMRTGISWGYKDDQFDYYRDLCNDIDLPWCGYHVIYPSQPAAPQIENVKLIIGDDIGTCKIPVWNDLELHQNMTASTISECCYEFGEGLQKAFGGEKGIYSSYGFVDSYMRNRGWFNSFYWWLAQILYSGLEHPGPFIAPYGVNDNRVLIEQTWWKYQITGHKGDVDANRWLTGAEQLEWFTGKEIEQPITDAEKLQRLWDAHPELHQ